MSGEGLKIASLAVLCVISTCFWWCEEVQCGVIKAARALST